MTAWFTSEDRTIRRLYATATKEELCEAIPNHDWGAIQSYAQRIGLRKRQAESDDELPPLHAIAQTLKDRRVQLGLSQTELAIKADLDRANVCKLERGGPLPGLRVLTRLCRALDLQLILQPVDRPQARSVATDVPADEARA